MLQTPSFKHPAHGLQVLCLQGLNDSQSTLIHQGRVPGQNAGKFAEGDSYTTLENSFFPLYMCNQTLWEIPYKH